MSFQALVLLPSYNSGSLLAETVREALARWKVVWVILDGSSDGSGTALEKMDDVRVITLPQNGGKGAAVEQGMRTAASEGFTHALVMDADGQHDGASIVPFLAVAAAHPSALIAGVPVFGADAPLERVRGRLVGNSMAAVECRGRGAQDALFGFRVYPIAPALKVFEATGTGRAFDFDTVLAVKLAWAGLPVINLPTPVRYPKVQQGGVTHFRYLRDNLLLARVHFQLGLHFIRRMMCRL